MRNMTEKFQGKYRLEDFGVGERIILKWMSNKIYRSVDWVQVAQNMIPFQAIANKTMCLRNS